MKISSNSFPAGKVPRIAATFPRWTAVDNFVELFNKAVMFEKTVLRKVKLIGEI